MITHKFDYKSLSRKNINNTRHYLLPDGSYVPSVTSILSKTKPKESVEALNAWRNRVGLEEAQKITTQAANVGTIMHKNLEEYLLGNDIPEKTNIIYAQAKRMSDTVITEGLTPHASEIYGVEVSLYYSGVYAGSTDCVALWDDELAILDFKQTNKPKKREWIEDYFLQGCLYAAAHNDIFGTDIRKFVVLMCSRDFQYQEFILEGSEFDDMMVAATKRVEQYYSLAA